MSSEIDNEMKKYISAASRKLIKYNPKKVLFSSWKNLFLNLVTNLEVPDSRKSEFFSLMLSRQTLRKLKEHLDPRDPKDLPFDELVAEFIICSTKEGKKDYRQKFLKRKQQDDETIEEYALNLGKLYKDCEYKRNFDERLCTRFINGLTDRAISWYLDRKKNITFEMAVQKAIELQRRVSSTSSD